MRKAFLGLAAAALLAVPACGGDDDSSAAPSGTTTVTVTETATAPPTPPGQASPTPSVKPWPTAPVTVPFKGSVPSVPQLLAIRVGGHPVGGYDRVALKFDKPPGYSVKYQSKVVYDGSGEPVELPGAAYLQIVANPAQAHDDAGPSPLAHPPTVPVRIGLPALTSYVLNGDFEGHVSVALGLAEKSGLRVNDYRAPTGHYVVYVDRRPAIGLTASAARVDVHVARGSAALAPLPVRHVVFTGQRVIVVEDGPTVTHGGTPGRCDHCRSETIRCRFDRHHIRDLPDDRRGVSVPSSTRPSGLPIATLSWLAHR